MCLQKIYNAWLCWFFDMSKNFRETRFHKTFGSEKYSATFMKHIFDQKKYSAILVQFISLHFDQKPIQQDRKSIQLPSLNSFLLKKTI